MKLFRIGSAWINLAFVVKIDVWPAQTWGDGDELRPRMIVSFLQGGIEVPEREAVKQGYADMAECEAALVAALEA